MLAKPGLSRTEPGDLYSGAAGQSKGGTKGERNGASEAKDAVNECCRS